MAKTWTYVYNENKIEVKNGWTTELLVNGQQQDGFKGIAITNEFNLKGRLDSGEEISAALRGKEMTIECQLYIDGELQKPATV
jgi:hypothetical protein